ncbi:hypothetical protein KKG72_02585 [bacterium]|nr:hypothetical protein [bacterium]MBU1994379.1 hypothetical protein [bacterium]
MRLTLDEYAKHFKMSKEMIHSKLRSKRLNYIIENGVTYIIVTKNSAAEEKIIQINQEKKEPQKIPVSVKPTVATVISLYQRENKQLKDKITQLESKIDKLIDDKEQMLRSEMEKIEQVYSTKDAQLKNILELIHTKLMIEQKTQTIHEVESYQTKSEEHSEQTIQLVELKEYLKTLDLESYQRKIIKKRFLAVYDNDVRIIQQNGKLYLDFSKYDYSDLLQLY